jgi:hypothetical protein
MKVIAEFVPKRLEKALDLARHIATFAKLEFKAGFIQMRLMDPSKIIHMDMILVPETYKCDAEFDFGVNLQMFYKLFRSMDNNESVEIEADESVLKLNQTVNHHTLINQDVPFGTPATINFSGQCVTVSSKLLQRYVRALANVAPSVEVHYCPNEDTLFLQSVNSMYRTLFAVDTRATPNEGEEYRKEFMVKFLETVINPSLSDDINLTFGDNLQIDYRPSEELSIVLVVSSYTEA